MNSASSHKFFIRIDAQRMAPFDGNFGTATSGALQVPTFNEQSLLLSEKDLRTLYFIGGYTLGIFVLWNFPVLKHLLYPFKLVGFTCACKSLFVS